MGDQLRVNGVVPSWAELAIKIGGEVFYGVTSVKYGEALEADYVYGMGRAYAPRGMTSGKYTPDPLVLTMETKTAQDFRALLAQSSSSGKSVSKTVFQVQLSITMPDESPLTVDFEDCRVMKFSADYSEGTNALMQDIECKVMRIKHNGVVLYDDSESSV